MAFNFEPCLNSSDIDNMSCKFQLSNVTRAQLNKSAFSQLPSFWQYFPQLRNMAFSFGRSDMGGREYLKNASDDVVTYFDRLNTIKLYISGGEIDLWQYSSI